jgi:hypothetical protein
MLPYMAYMDPMGTIIIMKVSESGTCHNQYLDSIAIHNLWRFLATFGGKNEVWISIC